MEELRPRLGCGLFEAVVGNQRRWLWRRRGIAGLCGRTAWVRFWALRGEAALVFCVVWLGGRRRRGQLGLKAGGGRRGGGAWQRTAERLGVEGKGWAVGEAKEEREEAGLGMAGVGFGIFFWSRLRGRVRRNKVESGTNGDLENLKVS